MDELNAMDYSGYSLRPLEVQSEWGRVVVEDVDFESWSEMVEFDRRGSNISKPLNVQSHVTYFFPSPFTSTVKPFPVQQEFLKSHSFP